MAVDPMYLVGTKVEMKKHDSSVVWHRGIICVTDKFGYWYDVALEGGTKDNHPVYENVWHERIRRRE